MNTHISVSGLGKKYKLFLSQRDRILYGLTMGRIASYEEHWALSNVSFDVRAGEAVAIIGRNGSGKSTLLQLVAGTLTPSEGVIQINGRVAALLELGSGFNSDFTGIENIYMYGALLGLSTGYIDDRLRDILDFSGIGDYANKPISTYSSGMLMRLAFSVAISVEPEILIVDEALAVGDAEFQFRCLERIKELLGEGLTLLFVSHDTNMIKMFCDTAIYLEGGRVKKIGGTSEVIEDYLEDIWTAKHNAKQKVRLPESRLLNKRDGRGFGSGEGKILGAKLLDNDYQITDVVMTGQDFTFEVDVEYTSTLSNPSLTFIMQDRRRMEISSWFVRLESINSGNRIAKIRSGLLGRLNHGIYFLTLRLEERMSETSFLPVEKQVAALQFEVLKTDRVNYSGLVDLRDSECVDYMASQ